MNALLKEVTSAILQKLQLLLKIKCIQFQILFFSKKQDFCFLKQSFPVISPIMVLSLTQKVDAANIGLMVFSCIVAFILPFEVFLFSYGVLGPLHYLTEIGWLHKKGYFTTGKYDYIFLAFLAFGITLGFLGLSDFFNEVSTGLIYLGFLAALAMVTIKDNSLKAVCIILLVFSTLFIGDSPLYQIFFAVYLPTIIHVFIFTALFIIYGALKNKSPLGFVSVIVFAICAFSFFYFPAGYQPLASMEYIQQSYRGFAMLNQMMLNLFGFTELKGFNEASINAIFNSQSGYMVMRFVAFAYTYHYLNWFSKTSIIQWHKVPKSTLAIVVVLWVASILIYAYDYMVGLKWLFLLSFLHVLLEFPLNYRSVIGIGQEIKGLFVRKQTAISK